MLILTCSDFSGVRDTPAQTVAELSKTLSNCKPLFMTSRQLLSSLATKRWVKRRVMFKSLASPSCDTFTVARDSVLGLTSIFRPIESGEVSVLGL